jgi:hypothetical protein
MITHSQIIKSIRRILKAYETSASKIEQISKYLTEVEELNKQERKEKREVKKDA